MLSCASGGVGGAFLALFPGVYGVDAQTWYYEFSHPEIPISSQWSPVYCGLWYAFVRFGEVFLNSNILGFGLFTAVQMGITLYAIWRFLKFTADRMNEKFVIGVTVFFMMPTHAIMALTSAQDALFSVCFGMAVLYLLEYILDEDNFWKNKKKLLKLVLWLLLMCMIRNNGLYALLVMLVILAFIKKTRRLLLPLTAVVVLVFLYQNPVYDMMGIEKGTAIREMLSLPLQQMAYLYNNSESLTEEQRNEMQLYVSKEGWQAYEPCISDQVKSRLNVEAVKNHKLDFLKLYVKCFLADPKGYLQAAGLQTFSLWYPYKAWPDPRPWHPYLNVQSYNTTEVYDGFSISRKSLCPPYELILRMLFGYGGAGYGYGGDLEMSFTRIPVLNELCQAGTYTWILVFEFFYAIYKRKKGLFVILGIELGLWLTVFLSPVIMYRYCAPLIFTAPLYIMALLLVKDRK